MVIGPDTALDITDEDAGAGKFRAFLGLKEETVWPHAVPDDWEHVCRAGKRPERAETSSFWAASSPQVDLPPPPLAPEPWRRRLVRRLLRLLFRPPYHSGEEILGEAARRRVRTLLRVEAALPADADYAALIAPACVALEHELSTLLLAAGCRGEVDLVDVLHRAGRANQAELLRKWQSGYLPMTIGIQVIILTALEKTVGPGTGDSRPNFMFTPRYAELLCSGRLSSLLDRVRTDYRNPACHGTRTFGREEYAAFARLLLTRDRLRTWYRRGPTALDTGLLDLHLLEWYRCRLASPFAPGPASQRRKSGAT
jgi:hypothetical protein